MKNEYVLDFTGLTLDGAKDEITRYILALSSTPSQNDASKDDDTYRNKTLDDLRRLKSIYQKALSEIEDKINQLEEATKSTTASNWLNTITTHCSVSELVRKQNAQTMHFLIDTSYSRALEAKKQVRKSDIVFISFYQCYSDMYPILEPSSYESVIVKPADMKAISPTTQAKPHKDFSLYMNVFLRRCMQINSVAQAERFYFYTTHSDNQEQDSESSYTRTFRTMLASHLFEWRKTHGCTKQDLSQYSNIERTTISNLETMRQSASIDKIIKLLQATGAGLVIVPIQQIGEE